jgi:hypothetical protein
MPPSDTDDDARKAAKGRIERLSVPGVPTRYLKPPRPTDPEATPPQTVLAKRAREQTRTDWPAAPPVAPRGQAVGSTPVPGERRDSPPPRNLSPAPVSLPEPYALPSPPAVPGLNPSLIAKAASFPLPRLLVLIAASGMAASGFVAALGQAASQIIMALKPSYERTQLKQEIEQELEPIKARVNANFGLDEETKTRRAKDGEHDEAIAKLRSDFEAVKPSLPQIHGLPPDAKTKPKPKP